MFRLRAGASTPIRNSCRSTSLIPDDDSDDVYLYGYKEVSEEEFELIDIEDDDEFDKVVKVFEELTDEE